MSGNTYPKKLQLSLTEEQHERLRRVAFERKESMQGCLRGCVEALGSGLGQSHVPVKKAPEAVSAPRKPFTFAKATKELKEGYGWCKGCGVKQVELPAFLCGECRKEAGEDV